MLQACGHIDLATHDVLLVMQAHMTEYAENRKQDLSCWLHWSSVCFQLKGHM